MSKNIPSKTYYGSQLDSIKSHWYDYDYVNANADFNHIDELYKIVEAQQTTRKATENKKTQKKITESYKCGPVLAEMINEL